MKVFDSLLAVVAAVAVSLFGLAASTTCGTRETIDTDGSCQYQRFETFTTTSDEAKNCCSGDLTYLMPRPEQVSDYGFLFSDALYGPYITSFSIRSNQLVIDGIPVAENLTEKWRHGEQPVGDVPCIAAEYNGPKDYLLYPADCNDPFKVLCIKVTENCSCEEHEQCVGKFSQVCEATCQNRSFAGSNVDPKDPIGSPLEDPKGPTSPHLEALVTAPLIGIILLLLLLLLLRPHFREKVSPCTTRPDSPISTISITIDKVAETPPT